MKVTLFVMFFGILCMFLIGVFHEQVHVEIYKGYGIESKVKYFADFPDMTTYPESSCPTEECELANNINEAITYPLIVVFSFMVYFATMITMLLETKLNQNKF